MSNYDTIQAITVNLQTVLRVQGINFSQKSYDDESSIPAGLIPLGQIYYVGETFEFSYNEKPKYATASFLLKVFLQEMKSDNAVREQQKWTHLIRDALIVSALNIADISASKLISRVDTNSITVDNKSNGVSIINYHITIRYREV